MNWPMNWIVFVTVLALLQYLFFGLSVARARGAYGVAAPATTGNDIFERYYRVQSNTLELLVAFLPALWLAAHYWPPVLIAGVGAVFLVGRMLYFASYTKDPASRTLGFALSFIPTVGLLIAALVGALMQR